MSGLTAEAEKASNPLAGLTVRCFVFEQVRFVDEFSVFTTKHSEKISCMKLAVIYVRDGQASPQQQWFKNGKGQDTLIPEFAAFMNVMGTRKDMSTWKGYTGEIGEGEAFYTVWQDLEVVYHVAPELSKPEIRRLIGNDLVNIIFLESGTLNLDGLSELGNVPQVFIVVQPEGGSTFRVSFYQKSTITGIGPCFEDLCDLPTVRELVLTRSFNGWLRTKFCPPMSRLFSTPRQHALNEIVRPYISDQCVHGLHPLGCFFYENATQGTPLFLLGNKLSNIKRVIGNKSCLV